MHKPTNNSSEQQPPFSRTSLDGILFDLDGTLADTLPVCILAYQSTVQHFCGHWPEESEIYAIFGPSEEGMLELLIPGKLDETLPYFLERYEQYHSQCLQAFPGVEQIFSTLQTRGIRSAIVTGKGPYSAAISMRILGLSRWVETVETGFAHGANKAYSIGLVLRRWQLPPEHAAYVGDTPSDMSAARAAGLLPVGAAWAGTSLLRDDSHAQEQPTFYDIDRFIQWIEQA
jgi:pyrophosphatase PpaX